MSIEPGLVIPDAAPAAIRDFVRDEALPAA
jgi:hypothetical protein